MERLHWKSLLLIVIAALILFNHLGGVPLLDPDEPVYGETAKEMINFNDFLSPRIYGEYWYDKPPMYYWLVAGAFSQLGVSEFAARLPSALLGFACVLYVYLVGSRLFSNKAGLLGALILVTSGEFFYISKAAVTDITLTLFLTMTMLSFLEKRYYLMYICAGLATLTKGPVGIIFPGAVILLYFLAIRDFSHLRKMKIPVGILLTSAVVLPWYWFMVQAHGQVFIDTFIGYNNITRFISPEHPEIVWYFFIPVFIGGFFPWSAILIPASWTALTESREDFRKLLFLIIWAAFIFVFFTISRTKLISYILPMFPPMAMVVGWYVDWIGQRWGGVRTLSWPIILSVLCGLLCAALFWTIHLIPALLIGVIALVAIFVIMTLGVWYYIWRLEVERALWLQVGAMTLVSLVVMIMIFPQAAPAFSCRGIANEFLAKYDGKSPVYICKFLHPGFTFYTNEYGKEFSLDELAPIVKSGKKAYFVMRQSEYNGLTVAERQKLTTLAATGDSLDQKLLLLNP